MSPLLKKKIQKIKTACEEQGTTIVVEQTKDDSSWTLSNFSTNKSVIIGEMMTDEDEYYLAAFKINVRRWNWAIDEGFTRDEIVSKLSGEVFEQIKISAISQYLK